jgi:hypothetical protein
MDEPGLPGDRNGDVVGKVLGHIEALETVDTDIFVTMEILMQTCLKGNHLPSQAIGPILDGPGRAVEVPGQCPDTHRFGREPMEFRVVDQLLGPVVDPESLGREAFAAGPAPETGYLAKGIGAVVPGPGPPPGKLGFQMMDTVLVGTEGRNQFLAPVYFVRSHTLPYVVRIRVACAVDDLFWKNKFLVTLLRWCQL